MLGLDHLGPADHEALGQPRAHGLGDVGHRVEFGDPAMIEPVIHLARAQLCLLRIQPGLFEQRRDALARQAEQVDTAIATRGYVARNGYGVELPRDRDERCVGHDAAHIGAASPMAKPAQTPGAADRSGRPPR